MKVSEMTREQRSEWIAEKGREIAALKVADKINELTRQAEQRRLKSMIAGVTRISTSPLLQLISGIRCSR